MERIFLAAAEVPTGIPTGLPSAVNEAASKIVAEGGITESLLILAIAAIVVLAWMVVWWQPRQHKDALTKQQSEHEEDRDAWEKRHQAISDQRIAEIREVMTALNNNTGALNVISQTQADRTASMDRLAAKLGELVQHVANLERLNGEHHRDIDRNHEMLRGIAWTLGGKGPGLPGPP
ncbi:hypothetical protein LOK46_10435 [Methylobacterium sp. NMS14P]|uniref:hypothetical protein n=1 Tax=Methylobacterium sp. NMS14P TaxID=2894310 RepID=UPI002359E80F|nr:hypothetical protein [Methylobacterium sp. NMS14P]WCS27206.1 hypothetical protein LOK46_10435 [Methylobacterium sp. NMS14P]